MNLKLGGLSLRIKILSIMQNHCNKSACCKKKETIAKDIGKEIKTFIQFLFLKKKFFLMLQLIGLIKDF